MFVTRGFCRDAADKVVQGQGKFEQLTVASQEIAASTAQLVFASRVKAELQSKNLQALAEASKKVSSATGVVVATAKHCAELVEDSGIYFFLNCVLQIVSTNSNSCFCSCLGFCKFNASSSKTVRDGGTG